MGRPIVGGALIDKPDDRDYPISTLAYEYKTWNCLRLIEYVRDQKYNDCVINTFNSCFEIESILTYNKKIAINNVYGLSNGFGYTIARQADNTFPNNIGLYPRDVVKQYHKVGISPEYFMPYDKYTLKSETNPKSKFAAHFFKIKRYEAVTVDQLPLVLSSQKPVCIAINIDGNFLKYNTNSEPLQETDGKNLGGHAILAVGVNYTYNDKIIITALNSWGNGLGQQGLWRMSLDYIRKVSGNRIFWSIYI